MRARLTWLLALAGVATGCSSHRPPAGATVSPVVALSAAPDRFFTNGDATLRYRDFGRGEPVILVHGYSRTLEEWVGIADSLALDHRVIVLDVRGFGQSTKFSDPARFGSRMADDVVRLMEELRIRRAHLAGHSMGALLVANLAARYPRRASSLSLIAGPFYRDSLTFAVETRRWLEDLEAGRGLVAFIQWLFPGIDSATATGFSSQALAQNDLGALIAVMRSTAGLLVPLDRAPQAPALVTVGTNDPLAPQSRDLADRWPRARLLEVAGADHVSILGRTELLAAMRALILSRRATLVRPRAQAKRAA